MAGSFNHDPHPSSTFTAMRQVHSQAWWSIHRSGSDTVYTLPDRPIATGQVYHQARKPTQRPESVSTGSMDRDTHSCGPAGNQHHYSIAQKESGCPGLSLNSAPGPMGRAERPQVKLTRAVNTYQSFKTPDRRFLEITGILPC